MKENKDVQIKFRLTQSTKAWIDSYCAAHEITVSEFMRQLIQERITEQMTYKMKEGAEFDGI